MHWHSRFLITAFGFCCLPDFLAGQAGLPFLLRFQQGANVTTLSSGATLTLAAADIGKGVGITLMAAYRGSSGSNSAEITRVEMAGASDFTISQTALPLRLELNQEWKLELRFVASTSARVTGVLQVFFTEATTTGLPGPVGWFLINLVGVAPEVSLAYILQTDGNVVPLSSGGTLLFPETKIAASNSAAIVVLNRGSGPANIKAAALTGSADFQLLGLPLLPGFLEGGKETRFTIRYSPKQIGAATATMKLDLDERSLEFKIQGSAVGPSFAYQLIEADATSALLPNQVLKLSDTNLGQVRNFVVRVRNTGNGEGQISAINLLGAGFQLADVPFLPTTLAPDSSLFFGLNFAPTQIGAVTGRLRIGNDTFEIQATVLGARLSYSYVVGSATFVVQPNGTVGFSPLAVGLISSIQFTITNEGATSATIASIGLTGPSFSLRDLPSLPLSLGPGERVTFSIVFAPTTTGFASAALRIDTQGLVVSGTGTPTPALPSFRFEGSGGVQEPLQQPAVGLTLDGPFPLALKGSLTIAVDSESFTVDPAVQFATGGRTISFTIPAESTRAVFSNNATQVRLQTGTVASTIRITPSFLTEGGLNLTPEPPPVFAITIPQLPPRLLEGRIDSKTASSFALVVTGYATGRSLTNLQLQFTAISGFKLPNTQFSLNVEPASSLWYRNAASQAFGGLFTATVPFTIQSTGTAATALVDALQSVAVTATNERGNSNLVTVTFR